MDAKLDSLQQILSMIQDAASSKYKPDEKGEVVLLRVGGKQGDEMDSLPKSPEGDEKESTAEKVAEQVIAKMLGKDDEEEEDDWADKLLKE